MSRFFPQAEYAEDQPLARTILTTHVLYRGIQSGAVVGIATGTVSHLYHLRTAQKATHSTTALHTAIRPTFSHTVFRHAAVGAGIGFVAMCVALPVRMKGREEIEWKDRSWRLLQNPGQVEVDDWSLGGASAAAVAGLVRTGTATVRHVVGRIATGSVVGVVGYLAFRYGMMQGKRKENTVQHTRTSGSATS